MTSQVLPMKRPVDRAIGSRVVPILARHATPISFVLLAMFAAIDHATGVDATFVVLTYLVPISVMTWFRTRAAAVATAALATACTTWVYVSGIPLAPASGVIVDAVGAFGMFVVTIWILDALRRHVERERAQRRAAIEQLRHAERLHVIGTLAAGVAHELGTPLNVISGAAEMLQEADPGRAKVEQLSDLIMRQIDHITSIVRQLLDFGRRSGGASGEMELDPAIRATLDLLAATARKHDVVLDWSGQVGADHPVRASARELGQVVSNLVLNGIQAMPDGGTLHVATRIERRRERPWAVVEVRDEGVGIAREHLPYIFDPFFTTKGIGEGTGLGLSVSYGIVNDWGGIIEAESTPEHGATFLVWIPLARA